MATISQIIVEDLSKCYRVRRQEGGGLKRSLHRVQALDRVSFTIEPGELVGYIGPNGAGKSTTIKILSGILTPDAGRCEVLGRVPYRQRKAHVAQIGVVFGQRSQLWWDLPVNASFELLRDIYRVEPGAYAKVREELVEVLDIAPFLGTPVRLLSLGQRMRAEIAASLLHSPPILFLDEPTIGLDAVSKLAVRKFILERNRREGTTVILTTHDMDDIASLCSRVMVIGAGKVLMDGTLDDLRRTVTRERLLTCASAQPITTAPEGARLISREGNRQVLAFDPDRISAPALIEYLAARHDLGEILIEDPPIEQVIAAYYQERHL